MAGAVTQGDKIAELTINTIRTLAMDAVEAATCGHPGTPMALAPVSYQLWTETLRYDPLSPRWPNRDRYVLSCGHASMLIYSLLHLAGVKKLDKNGKPTGEPAVTLEDIKNFRQWGSATPGHPEYGHTSGVETTTGPLGQGCGNSVGMAMASRWLAARYNKPGFELYDFNVYTQCSDGDLMEGVSCEAASLAGHLKLSNLCWIYDDNHITIEGKTNLAFSEYVPERFRGLGWHVVVVEDANDRDAFAAALEAFRLNDEAPTMIVVRSVIGYGAPKKAGTSAAHGEALGEEEIRGAKKYFGWPEDAKFLVPKEAPARFAETLGVRGRELREAWEVLFASYKKQFPDLAREIEQMGRHELPDGWDKTIVDFPADPKGVASRVSGGKALNAFAEKIPWLLGGSADLAPSTKTLLTFAKVGDFSADNYGGRNFHFGIREHGMTAAVNGMALCGLRPYGATFFVFCDYLRPSLRLAAIMGVPSILVMTHDSIGVGEDGPTHEPVEQLAATRAIPNVVVLRPGDANETFVAWRTAIRQTKRPTAIILSRQNIPTLDRTKYASADGVERGGYILIDAPGGKPDVILLGTGSELSLACEAHDQLAAAGIKSRVVSMPSFELFDEQPADYREKVLPAAVSARVAVEAGIQQGWDKYLGFGGAFVGMTGFGASAPQEVIYQKFGITADRVAAEAKRLLAKK